MYNTDHLPSPLPEGEGGESYVKEHLTESNSCFILKTCNEWVDSARLKPIPRKLFGELWFEGEICILFADTNVGKSILAMQIADQISRGRKEAVSSPAKSYVECEAQKVVYFDFELTAKQLESRFSEVQEGLNQYVNHYQFHENFFRAEVNPNAGGPERYVKFEDFINSQLEHTIAVSGAKVIIIDNLTYMRDETENAKSALPLMKYLKSLKSKYALSILALAHTPKRDSTQPLDRNDLQGSKMLINFCDSSFAIGESSRDPGLRYLKQIKARNSEIQYDRDNVLLARIVKTVNFLGFEFLDTASETELIRIPRIEASRGLIEEAKRLSETGLSTRKIGAELGISAMSVSRYLKL